LNAAVTFSKTKDEWTTPQDFWEKLNAEFQFTWDVAARAENSKCGLHYFGPDHPDPRRRDALDPGVVWGVVSWMNPPYSSGRRFIARAAFEARYRGNIVVCLVPARTDTHWWHGYVWNRKKHQLRAGVEVRFIKGRLRFGGAEHGAPFPSVVIVFWPHDVHA